MGSATPHSAVHRIADPGNPVRDKSRAIGKCSLVNLARLGIVVSHVRFPGYLSYAVKWHYHVSPSGVFSYFPLYESPVVGWTKTPSTRNT